MNLRKATHEGDLHLGDKVLSCAVLDDGTRVLTATTVFQAFDRPRRGRATESYRAEHMPSFIDANNLQPFLGQEVRRWIKTIDYQTLSGSPRSGYDARILRGLCKVYIDANRAGVLQPSQTKFVAIAEALLYALSDIGITALVDEATGYQYEREKDELQKLLKAYISEELRPWQKTFPDIYYKEIFRLNGWDFTLQGIRKRPGVVGKWTNKLIYEQLPNGVLEELKRVTPEHTRFHQSLTIDVGHPHLTAQINRVVTLMSVSDDWEDFQRTFNKHLYRSKQDKLLEDGALSSKDAKKKGDADRFYGDLFDDHTD